MTATGAKFSEAIISSVDCWRCELGVDGGGDVRVELVE